MVAQLQVLVKVYSMLRIYDIKDIIWML